MSRRTSIAMLLALGVAIGATVPQLRSRPATKSTSKSKTPVVERSRVECDLSAPPHEIIAGGGLYYLGTDTAYGYTASYAVQTTDGLIVIDPGLSFKWLQSSLRKLHLDVVQVKLALITHRHADHWFASRELVQKTGARILAHASEIPLMTHSADLRQYYSIHAQPIATVPTLDEVEPIHDGDVVELGNTKIHVLSTPGHTAGSLCFSTRIKDYDVLFSGDTIMTLSPDATDGDYMTRLGPQFGGDSHAYLTTLRRLSRVEFDILLPGHPLLGQVMDPVVGARHWKDSIPTRIAMLVERSRQYGTHLSQFLDGKAKSLAFNIFYLGETEKTACYVIRDNEGLVCVDPGKRSMETLDSELKLLGLATRDVRWVLLTGADSTHSGVARKLCDDAGANLYCGPLLANEKMAESLRPDSILNSMDEFRLGQIQVRALAGSAGAGADMCYLMDSGEHRILFGGDSVGRFPQDPRNFHPNVNPKRLPTAPRLQASLQFVRSLDLDFVLPAHPQYDESPYYYPGEWRARMQ